jgi:hypothetical protein
MKGRSVLLALLALVFALGLSVAGCGGGGKKSSAGTTSATVTATEAATTTEAVTTTEAATTVAATTTATVPNVGAFATSKNCREFAQLAVNVSKAFTGSGGNDLQQAAKALDELADKAPSTIRSDFKVVADAYDKIAEALKGVNLSSGKAPSADVLAKMQKLQTEINQQKLTAAEQHISTWVQHNCHS